MNYFESLPVSDDPRAPIFPALYGKPSGSHGGLSNMFRRLMDKAGIRVPHGAAKTGKGRSQSNWIMVRNRDSLMGRNLPGETLIVAIADGAGSSARSDVGAQFAVQAALDKISKIQWPNRFGHWIYRRNESGGVKIG